ncbi:MAG: XRE family transcriptional regulator [Clostridia bacterium]|nr:XRE family transcriptional regulator [Clostridia bacterium]
MVDVNMLKVEIKRNGQGMRKVAEKLGLNPSTLYRKLLNNGEGLTIREVEQLVDVLSLTKKKANEIFFKC